MRGAGRASNKRQAHFCLRFFHDIRGGGAAGARSARERGRREGVVLELEILERKKERASPGPRHMEIRSQWANEWAVNSESKSADLAFNLVVFGAWFGDSPCSCWVSVWVMSVCLSVCLSVWVMSVWLSADAGRRAT